MESLSVITSYYFPFSDSRNLPKSTLVTQPLPRYPMSPIHVSHARQSTGPLPSQLVPLPSQLVPQWTGSYHRPFFSTWGRVMCQLDIFLLQVKSRSIFVFLLLLLATCSLIAYHKSQNSCWNSVLQVIFLDHNLLSNRDFILLPLHFIYYQVNVDLIM